MYLAVSGSATEICGVTCCSVSSAAWAGAVPTTGAAAASPASAASRAAWVPSCRRVYDAVVLALILSESAAWQTGEGEGEGVRQLRRVAEGLLALKGQPGVCKDPASILSKVGFTSRLLATSLGRCFL